MTMKLCFGFLMYDILTCRWMRISGTPLLETPDDDKRFVETYLGVSNTCCIYIYHVHLLMLISL
jgi:hypothetical protein